MNTQHDILMQDPEYRKHYAIEGLVIGSAELIATLMEQQGLSQADLAKKLGRSRAWISQLLSGRTNMTIRTLAELVYELGAEVKLDAQPFHFKSSCSPAARKAKPQPPKKRC